MEKIKIKEAIVVEGKYDKIKLSRLFDTLIIPTDGFLIYKDRKNLGLIRQAALKNGVIVLTDSDSAGNRIRGYLQQCLGEGVAVKNAYIPEIKGKERRKDSPSKEGLLGVEGVPDDVIVDAVLKIATEPKQKGDLKKSDLYALGIVGAKDSHILRAKILRKLNLPSKLTSNRLLEFVNNVLTAEEFVKIVDEIKQNKDF